MTNYIYHRAWWAIIFAILVDPLGQPKITAGRVHCFRTYCPSVRPSPLFKSRKTEQHNYNVRYWRDYGSGWVDHWWHLSCFLLFLKNYYCVFPQFCSELILWRVDPVGPLSNSGGITELARINSKEPTAFSEVAWIPTLLPRLAFIDQFNSIWSTVTADSDH